ncbi:hypothetical protein [Stenotrophomonas sp. PS02298]|uniref:hypothetical protein n=1 Tax=Stenotrophomonas sp. PS02298 TaxID=2991424 RepID=UPI00249AD230|nr:hypothetical protein [Stenotrophomonas sp. PS02298]
MDILALPAGKKLQLEISVQPDIVVAILREVRPQFARHTCLRTSSTLIRRNADDELSIGDADFVLTAAVVDGACRWLAARGIIVEDRR